MNKKIILIIIVVFVAVTVSVIAGSEYYTSQQGFCGLCHKMEMTFESWAKSGHEDVKCVNCHFAPGKESILKAKLRGAEHIFASLFPEANAEVIEVRGPSKVSNPGCSTTQCHIGEKFFNRKIDSAENVPFTHKPHIGGIIEGKTLNCGTCHYDMESDKDHAASREACYLCLALTHILKVAIE